MQLQRLTSLPQSRWLEDQRLQLFEWLQQPAQPTSRSLAQPPRPGDPLPFPLD